MFTNEDRNTAQGEAGGADGSPVIGIDAGGGAGDVAAAAAEKTERVGGADSFRGLVAALWFLRIVTVAALVIDVYVHIQQAPGYDAVRATISEGELFRLEAGIAGVAAVLLLVFGTRRLAWLLAFLVAAGGLGAVLLYQYVNVGAFGPFPDMYEPIWFSQKTFSAWGEGAGAVTALIGLVLANELVKRRR